MRHLYECPMRWADLDPQGHVNNVVLADYLQEARVDMLRTHGRSPASEALAEGVVVVRHEVTYLEPMVLRSRPVRIECWVTEVRAASFTLAYEMFHDDLDPAGGRTVYVRARSVLTPYLFAAERPRRLTAEERASLAPYVDAGDHPAPARLAPVPRTELGHYPVHVRFSDVDVYRHVNNVKYFEYFQEARLKLIGRMWRDLPAEVERPAVVVAQTDVDYRTPIVWRPEPYDCWTAVTRVGNRSVVLEADIRDGETLMASARVVLVFFDTTTQRAANPPAEVREAVLAAQA